MTASSGSQRESFLDATRGLAMLGVMVAHFGWIYFARHPGTPFIVLSSWMMFAAPTFVLVSGILLGYIYTTRPARFDAFRIKLIDRGLFLLTIGHVVIGLAYVNYAGGWGGAARSGQILDAVGVAILIGPLLITRTSAATRLMLAAALLLGSWAVLGLPAPSGGAVRALRDTLVGGGGWWIYNFPVVPWVALYLVGTAIGQSLGMPLRSGDTPAVRRLLMRSGMGSIVAGLMLSGFVQLLTRAGAAGAHGDLVQQFGSLTRKLPPSPAFFLWWSGLALLLILGVYLLDRSGRARRLLDLAVVVGQNSLFIFLLQEHLFVLVLWTWNPPYGWYWPFIMLALIAIAVLVTLWWHRRGFGRFLTVGFGRYWGPRLTGAAA